MSQAITRAPQATGIFTSPYKIAILRRMRINSLRSSELWSVRSFSLSQYLRSKMIVDAKSKSFSLLKLYTLDNMLANSSKSSVPRQAFNRVLRSIRPPLLGPRIEFRFVISKNADLNVNQPVATSQMVWHISPGRMWGRRIATVAISARACCHEATMFYTSPGSTLSAATAQADAVSCRYSLRDDP